MPTIDEAYHNVMNTKYQLGEDFPTLDTGIEGVVAYDLSKQYTMDELIKFRTDHCFGIVDNQGHYYHMPDYNLTKHEELVQLLLEKGVSRELLVPHIKVNSGIQYFDKSRGNSFCPTMTVDNMDNSIPKLTFDMCYALRNLLLYTPRSGKSFQSKVQGNINNIGLNYQELFSAPNLDDARLAALTNIRLLDCCLNSKLSESLFEAQDIRSDFQAVFRQVQINKSDSAASPSASYFFSGQGDDD